MTTNSHFHTIWVKYMSIRQILRANTWAVVERLALASASAREDAVGTLSLAFWGWVYCSAGTSRDVSNAKGPRLAALKQSRPPQAPTAPPERPTGPRGQRCASARHPFVPVTPRGELSGPAPAPRGRAGRRHRESRRTADGQASWAQVDVCAGATGRPAAAPWGRRPHQAPAA